MLETWILVGAIFFIPPFYYLFKVISAASARPRRPTGPLAVCLSLWLVQWPILISLALDCIGSNCSRHWLVEGLQLVVFATYNLVPLCWLWWKTSPKSKATVPTN